MLQMRDDWAIAVTTINKVWKLHVDLKGGAHGHLLLPPIFQNSTFYMVSGWNPGESKVSTICCIIHTKCVSAQWTDEQNAEANSLLKGEIEQLAPKPIRIFPWYVFNILSCDTIADVYQLQFVRDHSAGL
jgi:hypothetical protein